MGFEKAESGWNDLEFFLPITSSSRTQQVFLPSSLMIFLTGFIQFSSLQKASMLSITCRYLCIEQL